MKGSIVMESTVVWPFETVPSACTGYIVEGETHATYLVYAPNVEGAGRPAITTSGV
jgi:hypothetical protein